ncbi:MAG: GNAT family N-acetyltransferase [Duncaniella sp.]|nr:GNAT family N-acetyltransferase [Duncaniella sp.]
MDQNNIVIRNLAGVGFDEVAGAFAEAFADYDIRIDPKSLADMLRRRGMRPELSFAAFDGGRIVSFILNGIGTFDGRLTAYDTGTGTVPDFRGRGLTDRIFAYSLAPLRDAGVGVYLLEVLTHNIPAVKIYERQGFGIAREFDCFGGDVDSVIATAGQKANLDITINRVSPEEISSHAGWMEFAPSWQNSFESIHRNPDAFVCLMAFEGGEPVGFGVSETAYGDITQLAVAHDRRRRGIGSRLLAELTRMSHLPRIKALNIPVEATSAAGFLLASTLTPTCRQYEMHRDLTK